MIETVLPMILDALIIMLLAGTIYYAARLTQHIKAFRESRNSMDKLLADLSGQILRAESAIAGLRENARQGGRDLQEKINEAQALREELQIMSQAGERLAGRLEKAIDSSPKPSVTPEIEFLQAPRRRTRARPAPEREEAPASKTPEPMARFAIRDPEFDEGMDADGLMPGDYEDEEDTGEFESLAEKELYEALRKRKTEAGGVS